MAVFQGIIILFFNKCFQDWLATELGGRLLLLLLTIIKSVKMHAIKKLNGNLY